MKRIGRLAVCTHGCGETVLHIRPPEAIGAADTQISATNVTITADLTDPDIAHRLWEYRGPRIGWVHPDPGEHGVVRSFRQLRVEHDCPATPAHLRPPRRDPVTREEA